MVKYQIFLILFLFINSVRCQIKCNEATLYRSSSEQVSRQLDDKGQKAINLAFDISSRMIGHIPVVGAVFGTFVGLISDISRYFEPGGVIERMIDDSIRRAFIEDKARILNADIQTIRNRIAALQHSNTIESKRSELTVAIHTCERIFYLFLNEDFPLRRDRKNSPIYLKAFVPIYVTVAKLMAKVEPNYIPSLEDKMSKLRLLVQEVHGQFDEARIGDLYSYVHSRVCDEPLFRNLKPQCWHTIWRLRDGHTGQENWDLGCERPWKDSLKRQSYREMKQLQALIRLA